MKFTGDSLLRRFITLLSLLVWLLAVHKTGEPRKMETGTIREPILAGIWYPEDPTALSQQIESLLNKVSRQSISGRILAVIVPHAGYRYSGQVAVHGYKAIQGKTYNYAIVLAPSHRTYFRGVALYPNGGYKTPLGIVPVDEPLSQEIKKKGHLISFIPEVHMHEHSIEIQLPFLQKLLQGLRIVPIVMGDQSWDTCVALSQAIASSVNGLRVLIVASSDLSHFHPYEEATKMDNQLLAHISNMDTEGLNDCLLKAKCEACGAGPIMTAMLAARTLGANKGHILRYANSGEITGAKGSVVGYASATILENPGRKKEGELGSESKLTKQEKELLHSIARTVIERRLRDEKPPKLDVSSPTLRELRGVFVTLNKHGNLRGCIGYVEGLKPLYQAVGEMAEAAAFSDPRFMPLTQDELEDIEIEISVLTPLKRVTDINEIRVGKHGIYIKKGFLSGLLLPQVAIDFGWDRETFLEQTCGKAGLPGDAWRGKDTVIYIFSADVF